jgi:hypothetical protein
MFVTIAPLTNVSGSLANRPLADVSDKAKVISHTTSALNGATNVNSAGQLTFADWLARQGTRCKDLDGDTIPCEPYEDQYIPANRSYIYATSVAQGLIAVVDYLGISARYLKSVCGVDLGTTTTGSITAVDTRDGRVLVSVRGQTKNAMAFVAEADPVLSAFSLPLLFGAREADVCAGARASLVDVEYKIEYYTNAAQPIVDNQWFGNPPSPIGDPDEPFDFRVVMIRAQGKGTMADGSTGRLVISQTGTLQSQSKAKSFDGFPVEFINLLP